MQSFVFCCVKLLQRGQDYGMSSSSTPDSEINLLASIYLSVYRCCNHHGAYLINELVH